MKKHGNWLVCVDGRGPFRINLDHIITVRDGDVGELHLYTQNVIDRPLRIRGTLAEWDEVALGVCEGRDGWVTPDDDPDMREHLASGRSRQR